MIKRYNNISLAVAAPGIIMQVAGRFMMQGEQEVLGVFTVIGGTVLVLVGFAYYAKAKGRSPVWCLAAFLSVAGLVILSQLRDDSGVDEV
ncbi:MAG: hypothetical protein R3C01_05935 [Planctomycetaceae bacterium]